jgi:hypothetical protein
LATCLEKNQRHSGSRAEPRFNLSANGVYQELTGRKRQNAIDV